MHITKKLTALTVTAIAVALGAPATGHASTAVDTSKTYLITTPSSLALDVSQGSRGDGAPVIQWGISGAGNQQWRFDPVGDNKYRIRNVNSGKCLTSPGGNIARGTKLVQWYCGGGRAGQEWRFFSGAGNSRSGNLILGGGYTMPSGETYYPALDVPQNTIVWGTQFQLWGAESFNDPTGLNWSSAIAQTFLLSALN